MCCSFHRLCMAQWTYRVCKYYKEVMCPIWWSERTIQYPRSKSFLFSIMFDTQSNMRRENKLWGVVKKRRKRKTFGPWQPQHKLLRIFLTAIWWHPLGASIWWSQFAVMSNTHIEQQRNFAIWCWKIICQNLWTDEDIATTSKYFIFKRFLLLVCIFHYLPALSLWWWAEYLLCLGKESSP